jgi:hypothetical protein
VDLVAQGHLGAVLTASPPRSTQKCATHNLTANRDCALRVLLRYSLKKWRINPERSRFEEEVYASACCRLLHNASRIPAGMLSEHRQIPKQRESFKQQNIAMIGFICR